MTSGPRAMKWSTKGGKRKRWKRGGGKSLGKIQFKDVKSERKQKSRRRGVWVGTGLSVADGCEWSDTNGDGIPLNFDFCCCAFRDVSGN